MIPPTQGSSLSQNSTLNKRPRENCYISGQEGPNEILKNVSDRECNVVCVVKVSDPEGETVTCFIPYKFAMMKSPKIRHFRKLHISPTW